MRVKRGNVSRKRHKKVLKIAKGYYGGLSKLYRPAKQVVLHALRNATLHRRLRKRDFNSLWIVRLNAAAREHGLSYSVFAGLKNKKNIGINKKMLSELAIHEPATFAKIVEAVKA